MKMTLEKFTVSMLKDIESIEMTVKHDDINNITSIRKFLITPSNKNDWDSIYYVYTLEYKLLNNGKVVLRQTASPEGKADVPSYTLFVPFSPDGNGYRIDDEHVIKGLNLIKEGFDTNWKDFDWEVTNFKINKKSSMKGYQIPAPQRKRAAPKKRAPAVRVDVRKMF